MNKTGTVILVCDDQPRMREAYTEALRGIENVTVETIEHPKDVLAWLRSNSQIRVLLMDLEFPVEPGGRVKDVIGHTYLTQIRSEFPNLRIVVVTQLGPQVYPIVLECESKGLHDAWIDVGKAFKKEEIRARVEPLLYPLGRISREGVWLVHLSDLHFGRSTPFQYWGLAEDGALRDAIQSDIRETVPGSFPEFKGKAHLIAVTGDMTDAARDEQFEKVGEFLRALASSFLERDYSESEGLGRVIVVPGNHDVNFDISRARCLSVNRKKCLEVLKVEKEADVPAELRYLKKYMWAPFERFYEKNCLARPSCGSMWHKDRFFGGASWGFPELGVLLFGLNSSAESVDHFANQPKVNPDVVRMLEANVSQTSKVEVARFLLVHHSLGSSSTGSQRVNDTDVAAIRKACFKRLNARIFLTGHVHEEITERVEVDGKSLLMLGAGSAGVEDDARPERQPLHYNLINVLPKGQTDGSPPRVTVYPRVSFKDEFVSHPKYPKLAYRWESGGWVVGN